MFGLSFKRDTLGKPQSIKQALKVAEVLDRDEIYGLERGNEIDGTPLLAFSFGVMPLIAASY
jgi:hypothetical protein